MRQDACVWKAFPRFPHSTDVRRLRCAVSVATAGCVGTVRATDVRDICPLCHVFRLFMNSLGFAYSSRDKERSFVCLAVFQHFDACAHCAVLYKRGRARAPTCTDVDSTPRASHAKGATNKRIDIHAASVGRHGYSAPSKRCPRPTPDPRPPAA